MVKRCYILIQLLTGILLFSGALANGVKPIHLSQHSGNYFSQNISLQKNNRPVNAEDVDTAFSGINKLRVNASYSRITVKTVKSNKLILHAYIGKITYKSRNGDKKIQTTKELLVKYRQTKTDLFIWVDAQEPKDTANYSKVNIEMTLINIEVPSGTDLSLMNATGIIQVNGLDGKEIELATEFGTIEASDIHTNLTITSNSGNVFLNQIYGNVHSTSGRGNVSGNGIDGNVWLRTTLGSIDLKNLRGNAGLHSSYGSQQLDSISGDVESDCASGNFTITRLKGNANISSSFGSQSFENVEGDVTSYSGSGNIKFANSKGKLKLSADFGSISGKNILLTGDSEFKTSSGSIKLKLANPIKDLRFNLQALSGRLSVKKENVKQSAEEKLIVGSGPVLIKGLSTMGNQEYY